MPLGNGPPKYFFEGVEIVIGGLPAFRDHLENASEARKKKLEPDLQSLSVLKFLLDDFFEDLKHDREAKKREAKEANTT
ncbi:MAG: hypothetical protein G01um10142_388 [Parcubacteria group bacterium Gr01-1014_2]|nr:MAG: hypothetical protein G01um10142_388 [Parcubacteria group bacterium Gr01-1014_2]